MGCGPSKLPPLNQGLDPSISPPDHESQPAAPLQHSGRNGTQNPSDIGISDMVGPAKKTETHVAGVLGGSEPEESITRTRENGHIGDTVSNTQVALESSRPSHRETVAPSDVVSQWQSGGMETIENDTGLESDKQQSKVVDQEPIHKEVDGSNVSLPPTAKAVDYACLRSFAKSKWPIRCLAPIHGYNVNAGPGGCASLLFVSNSYSGKGDTTAEIFLVRSGYDSNHHDAVSLAKSHDGHFGPASSVQTDEDGFVIVECLFGSNHLMLLSNDPKHGNITNGIFLKGPNDMEDILPLPLNINAGNGGEVTLLMCCGLQSGIGQPSVTAAAYMIRSGNQGNYYSTTLVCGEDSWKFQVQESGLLCVSGVGSSRYTLYHNRETPLTVEGGLAQSQAVQVYTDAGEERVVLLPYLPHHTLLLVLCSNSYGVESATSAALYMLSLSPTGPLSAQLVNGRHGTGSHHAPAQWTFEIRNDQVVAHGPPGFCRYAVLATLKGDPHAPVPQCQDPLRGFVSITKDRISGSLAKRHDVVIHVNEGVTETVASAQLVEDQEAFSFQTCIKEKTKSPGLYLIRVFAVKIPKCAGVPPLMLELTGSPQQVAVQPQGVLYALNCGGPSFQATNDIVYLSELRQFANFSPDLNYGASSKALGWIKSNTGVPQLLTGGHDGHLYCRHRSTFVEAEDERRIKYTIENLPNGTHKLRFHSVGPIGRVVANDKDISSKLSKDFSKQKEVSQGNHMHQTECPVTVSGDRLELYMENQEVCGLALLDSSYREKVKSKAEQEADERVQQHLCNTLEPLTRSMLRKQLQIVGWSQNLLQNSSGQLNSLAHWNLTGNWSISEGGYGTEKSFVSSFMDCIKYQEINLCEYFSPEYLDTQPPIQVYEWYREGSCGGGYYSFTASLMDTDGNELKSYTTGQTGKLYNNSKWQQASVTFTDFGPGVRRISIESFGKDDKYWAGHYGPMISGSVIRVKREVKPAKEDKFADINMGGDDSLSSAMREKLVNQVLSDNKQLLEDLKDTDDNGNFDKVTSERTTVPRRHARPRKPREIRVFVSSTFRDMQGEREQLIKKTFRELNNICTERGVFFTYVDLRWGISSEQTSFGQTIAICLQEIDRCRPYFICMLGERFGWSQREDQPDELLNNSYSYVVENFPKLAWVDEYRYNTSVTQLEVLHAVLNNIQIAKERSFFYLRSPATTESIGVSEEELKMYQSESDWHYSKVCALRKTIEDSDLIHRYYDSPGDVCELIKQDLVKCIDTDFPIGSEPSALEREMEAHKAFADARCRVYIGRREYFQKIEDYFSCHKTHPLVILGESGSGKSSLVANWTQQTSEKHVDAFIFLHFIGSSAESASYLKLIRRLYEEMKEYFGLDLVIPTSDAGMIRDLSKWLTIAGSKARCVIVLDALNQLDDGIGEDGLEHDLLWLPSTLPPNVYMLLSTLPGRAYNAILAAGWPTFKVSPLDPSEKEDIITGYLSDIYGKTLNSEQKGMVISAPQTNNPLYLRVLLDEVRMYGIFNTLTEKIRDYLLAGNPADLFAKILVRLEEDMEQGQENRPYLVRDTTTAIWCSNRGMSESELIDLLQINSVTWSPFYLSLVESLVNRNGILNFFHDHLRHAVEKRYLATQEAKREGYLRLVHFFSGKPLDNRTVVELPFLLAKAGEMEKLRELVSNLEVFKKLTSSEEGKFDLIKSWKMLGEFTEVEKAYLSEVEKIPEAHRQSKAYQDLMTNLGEFFLDLGLLEASRCVFEGLLSEMEICYKDSHSRIVYSSSNYSWRKCCIHPDVLNVLQRLGTVCQKQNDLDKAKAYYMEAISRQNRIVSPAEELTLCEGLLGLAEVFYLKEDMKEAKKLLLRSQELGTHVLGPKHHYVAAIISKLGQMCYKQSRLAEALGYFMRDLKLTRGDVGTAHPRTAGILNDVGLVYDDQSNPLAGRLFEAALAILLDVYGSNHVDVAVVRYNLGAFYFATNYYARAKFQFTEAHKVFLAFLGPDHADTISALEAVDAV